MPETLFHQWFVEEAEESWETTSLFDVVEIVGGGTPKTDIAEYWGGGIKWNDTSHYGGAGIVLSTFLEECLFLFRQRKE